MAGTEIGAKAGGCAFRQGSTWGTAVAVQANGGIKLTSYSENGGQASLPNEEVGAVAGSVPDIGNEGWQPSLNGKARYGNFGRLLAFIFGTSGNPTQTPPATGTTYLHTLTWQTTLDKFLTLCLGARAGAKPHEFPSEKINEVSLTFTDGGELIFKVDGVACARERDSSTNDAATFAAATVRAGRRQVMGSHATFRMNTQSGGALASTADDIKIRSFELRLRRPMQVSHETQSTEAVEPFEEGAVEVMFTITLRSYETDAYIALWEDLNTPTAKKADIKFLSGYTPTDGAEMYLQFDFPYVVVNEDPRIEVPGGGRIPHTVTFKAIAPPSGSAPTGMSATGPVMGFVLDEVSTAYLS